ncbi:MAG: hypothetical protein WBE11_15850 [Candidatus Aminicenantaceae bacterium]
MTKELFDKFKDFSSGERCPKCDNTKLYTHIDRYCDPPREYWSYRCASCNYRYSPDKLDESLEILFLFSRGRSAHLTAKYLPFSYNKIHRQYLTFLREIKEYADENNIPAQPSILEANYSLDYEELTKFHAFVKLCHLKPRRFRKENLSLYQRYAEFRYYYRKQDIKELIFDIHLNALKKK